MRRVGRSLFAVVVLVLFCGFFPAAAAAAPQAEVAKPLRIGWWGSQTRHDRTLAVLDMFTKKYGVQFEPEFYNFDDYFTKLRAQIPAGDAPDIMQMGGNYRDFWDQIEFLNDYVTRKVIDTSGIDPSFIGILKLDGQVVGISNGTNAQGMAYDPEMFKAAGVPLPTNKWTWADYEKAAMTIREKTGKLGSSQLDEWPCFSSWITQYAAGQSFFKEPYREALNYTNDEPVAEFYAMKKRLTDAKAYPNPAQMAEIKNVEGDPLVRGEAAMMWLSSNQFVAVTNAAKKTLALTVPPRRTPTGPLSQTIMSSQHLMIYRGSKQKELAAKFINFWVNDIAANQILLGERGIPINTAVRAAVADTFTTAEQKAVYNYMTVLGKEASVDIVLDSPKANEIRDVFKKLGEQVVFGQLTPMQAAVELHKQAEAILATKK
jgi:multiple sugar transport system substrate-binding protein